MTKSDRETRTIIVGDVHGCIDELDALLTKVDYASGDRLIFVGDLIYKGPDSVAVLRRARSLGAQTIQGNHELSFLKACALGKFGRKAESVRRQMGSELTFWVDWIESWPSFIEDDAFLVVHAGLVPNLHPRETPVEWLTRIRTWDGIGRDLDNPSNPPWFSFYTDSKLVVFGHWAQRGLVQRANAVGLDTGCVYGYDLTALILPDRRLISVPAKKAYCPIKTP